MKSQFSMGEVPIFAAASACWSATLSRCWRPMPRAEVHETDGDLRVNRGDFPIVMGVPPPLKWMVYFKEKSRTN